ncbi:tyrosine-type recombinase/integrase [Ornithinimicrobium cryptoxanthini]|uniref:Site-specific integrase n=1 Tax=Ornithinimicrobium cryptoxanthini TaxID=2934161 RepID=A0ABY4YIC0_9MICO|nr:tyrosine-type recombinase/integrase [Ornithinimicrobium cryptoxanthini]USQ76098.1 site-specific integrase [Ornithinimicrobium cryptoxanthini]
MTLLGPSLQSYFTDHAHAQKGLSPNTVASYRDTWRLLIKHLSATTGLPADKLVLGMLDVEAITAFLDHLETDRGNSPTTRNARLTAIRAVLAVALPDHPEHADTLARVLALPARRRAPRVVQFLEEAETEALLAAPDAGTWTGHRDRALLTLAVQTGLRISELIALTTSDVHTGTGPHVTCTGKGRRYRATPLTAGTLAILVPYLDERSTRPGVALFPGPRGQHLSRDALERRLAKHLITATKQCPSLGRKHVTMHTLRHTAAMRLLQSGVDVAIIALWLGHQNTTSTDVYLHADMTIKQTAIDRTRDPSVTPGTYTPPADVLAFLDSL